MSGWLPIETAPLNVILDTKIHDAGGARNEQPLIRRKRDGAMRSLWFLADGSMYVYYTPTHWRPRSEG